MIDCHVHIVPDNPAYPRALTAEDLVAAMDAAHVERAIVVQSRSGNGLDSTVPTQEAARFPRRLIAVCGIDPDSLDASRTLQNRIMAMGAKGVRVFWDHAPLGGSDRQQFWNTVASLDAPILLAGPARFAELTVLSRRYPELHFILDHCGDPAMLRYWPDELLRLADLPRVFVKYSSHIHERIEEQGQSPQHLFDQLVRTFGAGRILWGSNYPASHEPRWTYGGTVETLNRLISTYSPSERADILRGTACRLWPELSLAAKSE